MSADPLLVVILGPTASGKTALSLRLAEQFGGEIVSCDSVAVYRELEIGTATPTEAAARIHPNDTPKLIGAIEVCLLAGERLTVMWDKGRDPLVGFRILRIGLEPERNGLYERINARCAAMFEGGLIDEGRRLLTA